MTADSAVPLYTERPVDGDRDLHRMYELAIAALDVTLHGADLPWRLSSPSASVPERTRLWEDAEGKLVAWAVLQFPWHCLDYQIRPDAHSAELESAVLGWGCTRLAVEGAGRDEPLPFYAGARAGDTARIAAIEQAGFRRESWGYIHLGRNLSEAIPDSAPPEGFVIRPLAGEHEVAAYVAAHRAAFGSTNMTEEWRLATLRSPVYVPDLDLVAIAPDGTLAGFCVCWITPPGAERRIAQVEPLGILPSFQRHGLGRALLVGGLRRAQSLGVERMEVNAESYNPASQGVYAAVGFRPAYEIPFFLRRFPENRVQ